MYVKFVFLYHYSVHISGTSFSRLHYFTYVIWDPFIVEYVVCGLLILEGGTVTYSCKIMCHWSLFESWRLGKHNSSFYFFIISYIKTEDVV